MKKFAAVLASLLVLACGTTVLAAPSADAEAYVAKVEAENATISAVEADVVTAAQTEAAKEGTLLAVVEVTSDAKTITFKVDGVKAGDNIVVLHQLADKTWEKITPDSVKDGEVTVTFKSLSPVAFVKVAAAADKAPATGAPVVLPVVALICAAGAAGCAKKVKFN